MFVVMERPDDQTGFAELAEWLGKIAGSHLRGCQAASAGAKGRKPGVTRTPVWAIGPLLRSDALTGSSTSGELAEWLKAHPC